MVSENGCPRKPEEKLSIAAGRKEENGSRCDKLSPPATIRGGKRIREILKHGSRINGKLMSIAYLDREGSGGVRVAFLVPGRTGNAVKRNKIRRILREEMRASRPACGRQADMLLLWKARISDELYAPARDEARLLLRRFARK